MALTAFCLLLQLSMWRCTDELRVRAHELHRSSKRDAKHYIGMYYFVLNCTFKFELDKLNCGIDVML